MVLPVVPELMPSLEFASNNQQLYEADEDIYGDFKEKYEEIKSYISKYT